MTDRNLPLTEPGPGPGAEIRPLTPAQESEIAHLVDTFYEVAREDPLLGPVFLGHVTDWGRHLATMRIFWGTVAYRDGRYAGRPIEAHRPLAEITPEHFERWLSLWDLTVDEIVQSEIGDHLKRMAARMGDSMSHRLTGRTLNRDAAS